MLMGYNTQLHSCTAFPISF